jgi:hypothetical protein
VTASFTRSGFENASKGMATAKMRGDGEYGSMTGVSHGRIASGGVLAGGRRCRVACSSRTVSSSVAGRARSPPPAR